MDKPRAIFFGTPQFAVPGLEALSELAQVCLVVTQPDRPSGRGMKLRPPPVKLLGAQLGAEVIQPRKVRTAAFAERLREAEADVAVVIAYGRILPKAVLEAPRLGCLNVHASLLPKLRGAAPIQWAIVNGERQTGVCLMKMDEGMDTGPELARASLDIGGDETAAELAERLSVLGAELLGRQLPAYLRGELAERPQDHDQASLAPMLTKRDGQVDWSLAAPRIHDLVRGMSPWPGAFSFLDGSRVKLHKTHVLISEGRRGEPGRVVRADRHGIEVACGDGVLVIDVLQPEGKRSMDTADFFQGHRLPDGARFARAES